jgi:hypothetical protein
MSAKGPVINKEGAVGEKKGEKYVTRGNPNFLLSNSFSISRLYRIPQNLIAPFLFL